MSPSISKTTPSAAVSRPPTAAEVTDPKGDGQVGPDLTSVKLAKAGTDLVVTWTLTAPLPTTDTAGLYLNVASLDGSRAGQLGLLYLNGRQISHFVMLSGERNNEIPSAVTNSGNTITASFPLALLSPLGSTITWQAVATAARKDSDTAPDPGPDWLHPKTYAFDL